MKHLTLTLEEEVCLLDKYGLTPNELLVVRILLILQDDNAEDLFQKLMVTLRHVNLPLREVLNQLQKKEIILKSYKIPNSGEKFDPYAIPINKNFIKALYKSSFEMGKELFDSYPQFGNINGSVKLRLRHSEICENPSNCWKHISFSNFLYFKVFGLYLL